MTERKYCDIRGLDGRDVFLQRGNQKVFERLFDGLTECDLEF